MNLFYRNGDVYIYTEEIRRTTGGYNKTIHVLIVDNRETVFETNISTNLEEIPIETILKCWESKVKRTCERLLEDYGVGH